MSWLPSAAKESRLRTAGGDGASDGRRPSSPFRVILPSAVREPSRSVRREVRMPASSKTIVRGWGAVLGLEDVPEGLRRTPPGVVQGKAAVRRVRRARRIGVGGGVRAGHAAVVVRRGTVRHVRSSGGDGRGPAVSAGGERIEGGARVQPQPRLARTVRPRRGQRPVHADEGFRLRQEIPLHA